MNQDELADLIEVYYDDPVGFAHDFLDFTPTPQQAEMMRAVAENRRVTARSGHGIGKTRCLAAICWWFLVTRYCPVIPCTAPTAHQLFDNLFKELVAMMDRLPPEIASQFDNSGDRIWHKQHKKTWYLVARTAAKEKPDAIQGFHNVHLLVIVEEASGVPDAIFEPVEGILTQDDNRIILVGNPTRTQGYFYDSHNTRGARWKKLRFSSADSPIVSREYVDDMRAEWGEESSIYRVRVLGEFPLAETDQFIPLHFFEDASNLDNPDMPRAPICWSLDPARFGDDDSALIKRHGDEIMPDIKTTRKRDLMHLVGWVSNEYLSTPEELRPEVIFVDEIGLGAGVVDRLKELGFKVIGVNVSRPSKRPAKFFNLRAEAYSDFREAMGTGRLKIPRDERLFAEGSGLKYKYHSNGTLIMESKDDARRRGFKSPNIVDAIVLTFCYPMRRWSAKDDDMLAISLVPQQAVVDYDEFASLGSSW